MAEHSGDFLVLGAGGKMGLSLSRMARRCLDAAGHTKRRVIAVSRFGDRRRTQPFEEAGVESLSLDLLDDGAVESLPDAPNVLYLVGMKFGSTGDPSATWAMNTFLPGLVARRFAGARIVALSTGNVYGLADVRSGGAVETDPLAPVGEYAQSCLGRERMFAYYSERRGTPTTLIRLNYANDLRYGVLVDLAQSVLQGAPIDVGMGVVNVIWQGDANAAILQSFGLCSSPPAVLNVSGPETASVSWLATRLAGLLDAPLPTLVSTPADTAILSNCSRMHGLFGYPTVPLAWLLTWTASWLRQGGRTLDKPTKFQSREGTF
ncbi:MAG: NAD(P)-dependent oxidoreductase [Chloroflexi bacterium]|nr:NAD(P)-dependent oxidoreductase [Chloroflexota bacterium]